MSDVEHPVPPAGEEIHLPGGSIKPFMVTVGLTLVVIGTTIYYPVLPIIGFLIFAVTTYKWIQDCRHDVAHLPEDLGQPH